MPQNPDITIYETEYSNGDIIINAGEKGNEFYYIASGRVGVYINYGQPDQFKITELAASEFFGEAAIIGNTVRSATVVSLEKTVLQVIPLDNITNSIENYPDIYLHLIKNFYNNQNKRNRDIQQINGLLEEICGISARLVVNRVSMKMEKDRIMGIVEKIREVL